MITREELENLVEINMLKDENTRLHIELEDRCYKELKEDYFRLKEELKEMTKNYNKAHNKYLDLLRENEELKQLKESDVK